MPLVLSLLWRYSQAFRWGCSLIWGLTGEGYTFKFTHMVLAEFSFFWDVGLRASILCWLFGQFLATLSPVPCCMSWRLLSTWQMTSPRVKVGDGERGHPRQKPWSVRNLISDDKLHICHILFVISKSLTQPHTQGEGLQSLTGWISAFLTRYKQDFSVLSHGLL